jgi:hypothetical protein
MVCSIKEPKKLPTKAITDMIPSAIAVDRISDFRCLLICLNLAVRNRPIVIWFWLRAPEGAFCH